MHIVHLDGEWSLRRAGKNESIKATVPDTVHMDLLSAWKITDPYYRDNEDSLQWIGEVDWIYSRKFEIPQEFLEKEHVILRCEGLDTLAAIQINSYEIARTDNMFWTYEFDVKHALRKSTNTIEIRFDSTIPYIRKRQTEHPILLRSGPHTISGGNWVRKEQCNYGWDWGPCLLTCGIWRSIMLIGYDTTRLGDILVRQKHRKSGEVTLDIQADLTYPGTSKKVITKVFISRGTRGVTSGNARFRNGKARIRLVIDKPELWWPNGMGEQPLYNIEVNLLDDRGNRLDTQLKRIGLRTLRLQRKKDRWGECFRFVVNDIPFFAKGANWIPADTFAPNLTVEGYTWLIKDAAEANMNMLRVWGGGIYEPDLLIFVMKWVSAYGRTSCLPVLLIQHSIMLSWLMCVPRLRIMSAVSGIIRASHYGVGIMR